MKPKSFLLRIAALLLLVGVAPARADIEYGDPHDPLSPPSRSAAAEDTDRDKTPNQLIDEARDLLDGERLLDARTKLLKALAKDPKRYEAHILLAGYYLGHVGHFRLAFKYIKQAQALFQERFGDPPYTDLLRSQEHAQMIYLESQIKLNLDDYQGSLDLLDRFTALGYYSSWYPGSRAWVLMKLGQIDEAIRTARLGVLLGAEPGRTLNMLGILLSMKGEREASLQIFKQAVEYEFGLGQDGQPATPLNNSGEVYKEMFQDDLAEASWIKSTGLPDGCEHVLPSLNLALLYLDAFNLNAASETMDKFESCVAQFPLRNGEEHRSLVHLARGRIALYRGQIDRAITHLEAALDGRQWFGKIGTDPQDLEAGARVSLSRALRIKNNHLAFSRAESWSSAIAELKERALNRTRAWWLARRAREILSEELSAIEDLYIRNTDSMIEYPTLGEVLSGFPLRTIERRVTAESQADDRTPAQSYYRMYLADAYIEHGYPEKAQPLLLEVISSARPKYDELLKLHARLRMLGMMEESSADYRDLAVSIFETSRAALRNYGLRLPVRFRGSEEVRDMLESYPLLITDSAEVPYLISAEREGDEYQLRFQSDSGFIGGITAKHHDVEEVLRKVVDGIFTEEPSTKRF